jgi:5-methylcytosine-specific restriction endonuclease McrA
MKQTKTHIKIREFIEKFSDDPILGATSMNGQLCVRPDFQREIVYSLQKQQAVIDTIINNCCLGYLTFFVKEPGSKFKYDLGDGLQRGWSILEFVSGKFCYPKPGIGDQFFHNLTKEEQERFLNYELDVILVEGTLEERLLWYKKINVSGEVQTDQEILNATYSGTWCTSAKQYFTKPSCPAQTKWSKYLSGSQNRQAWLETALGWISDDNIETYMAKHQLDKDASELWNEFDKMMEWFKSVFPNYRKEMKGLPIGKLYKKYKDNTYDPKYLEAEVSNLYKDDDVTKKSGIFEYLLGLKNNERLLSIRTFTDSQKATKYEEQKGICPKCGKHFELNEMEGDHIIPWSKGGKTIPSNLQMLCKTCNNTKSSI